MVIDEILEHAVLVTKLVWRKHGKKLSCRQVQRMVATDVRPHAYATVEDTKDAD